MQNAHHQQYTIGVDNRKACGKKGHISTSSKTHTPILTVYLIFSTVKNVYRSTRSPVKKEKQGLARPPACPQQHFPTLKTFFFLGFSFFKRKKDEFASSSTFRIKKKIGFSFRSDIKQSADMGELISSDH